MIRAFLKDKLAALIIEATLPDLWPHGWPWYKAKGWAFSRLAVRGERQPRRTG